MTAQPVSPTVSQDIALHCLDELGRPMSFIASFGYDAGDPYAVWLTFHVPAGEIEWAMARTLLLRGLTQPAGEGDIRLAPAVDEDGHAVVRMDFHSPEGRLVTEARTADLFAFLSSTWRAVPPGSEASRVDVDDLVERLRG
ncbi:SsgA family sporulation/cell division regulator [Nocardioides nanhaiensis]|uniref:SsgA family sporulation/cell division regulator n=1 Tax=Nocardioides nanhaiensis TaxID=1476871 RepID=A0ABP8X1L3_9ACTN